ncbi:MAG: serine/threonine protein kinase [Alphaproteobacteria bacterium]|nr:serine/threonine protein kinase [Alphaproteobacteria bacterium]
MGPVTDPGGLLRLGETVEKYVIEGELGQGGMARVYRVRHQTLGTHHALKVLTLASPGVRKRLLLEGRTQARLRHPNIVAVTDVLELPFGTGLILEFINGPTLEDLVLRKRELPFEAIDELAAAGVLEGVAYAHGEGLVHRDLKPANVLCQIVGGRLVPKVADFGLVKSVDGLSNTRSGVAMGTPRYMSPEQIRDAKHVDERTDVFAMGVVLYFLITGRDCFARRTCSRCSRPSWTAGTSPSGACGPTLRIGWSRPSTPP